MLTAASRGAWRKCRAARPQATPWFSGLPLEAESPLSPHHAPDRGVRPVGTATFPYAPSNARVRHSLVQDASTLVSRPAGALGPAGRVSATSHGHVEVTRQCAGHLELTEGQGLPARCGKFARSGSPTGVTWRHLSTSSRTDRWQAWEASPRCFSARRELSTQPQPGDKFKVLFCGVEFPEAYEYSKQLLTRDPSIHVAFFPREQVPQEIGEYEVVVPRMTRLDAATLARAKKLRLIVQFGVGLEGVDIPAATAASIQVARIGSSATGNAVSCAEHCIYLILGLLRDQHGMARAVKERRLGQPIGQTLFGKNVLIVGYGGIGRELAPRLRPFGVSISAVRRSWNADAPSSAASAAALPPGSSGRPEEWPILGEDSEPVDSAETDQQAAAVRLASEAPDTGRPTAGGGGGSGGEEYLDERGGSAQLPRFLARADVVVMSCLLTRETAGMVDKAFLGSMKKGAVLVNIARGGLLDYAAVREALDSGHLGGLGIDVAWQEPFDPEDPIAQHPKVIITPHIGGVTELSYQRMAEIINETVQQVKSGQPLTLVEPAN